MSRNNSLSIKCSQEKGFSHLFGLLIFMVVFVIGGAAYLVSTHAANPYDRSYHIKEDRSNGLVYTNLTKTTRYHKCKGMFEASGAKTLISQGKPLCTHGPDAAKSDMSTKTAKIATLTNKTKDYKSQDGQIVAQSIWDSSELSPFNIPDAKCIGTGSDGQRVQLMYAYQQGKPDNSASYNILLTYLARIMDANIMHSHSGVKSAIKRIRWITGTNCLPSIVSVAIPNGADFGGMVDHLYNRGYNRNDRKYMVFVDYAGPDAYCGLGGLYGDDRFTPNDNNTYQSWAAVTTGCWGSGEIHEFFHVLGALQDSAPNTSGGSHCLDGFDVMCRGGDAYDGFPGHGVNGKPFSVLCDKSYSSDYNKFLLDCNHNDYYNSAATAGGYLGSHWNTARSGFLFTDSSVGSTLSMASTPSGNGYWVSNAQGDIVPYGDAAYLGSLLGNRLNSPIVSLAITPTGKGYIMLGSDGGVFCFGDAVFKGNANGKMTNTTASGIAITSSGGGYWIVDAKGGVYAFGDAVFKGSAYGKTSSPVVGIYGKSNNGYWLQLKDGGVFSYGTAGFYGSASGQTSTASSLAIDRVHGGYWIAANDGGVFAKGTSFFGSMGGKTISAPIISITPRPQGDGYWLLGSDGAVYSFGNARYFGRY